VAVNTGWVKAGVDHETAAFAGGDEVASRYGARGARELVQGIEPGVSQAGAGRPPATDLDPGLVDALRKLVEPKTRGDPVHPLLRTTK
jgi:hypothetical protein